MGTMTITIGCIGIVINKIPTMTGSAIKVRVGDQYTSINDIGVNTCTIKIVIKIVIQR